MKGNEASNLYLKYLPLMSLWKGIESLAVYWLLHLMCLFNLSDPPTCSMVGY